MEVGYQLEPLNKDEITHTQLVRYAGASGDFNQIHTVVPYAVEAGTRWCNCTWNVDYGFCWSSYWSMVSD